MPKRFLTKGVEIPDMSTATRDTISGQAVGTLIFNTTTSQYEYWTGSAWISLDGFYKYRQRTFGLSR